MEGFFFLRGMLKKSFILASSSPRRVVLLKTLGYHFNVIPHRVAEECVPCNALPVDFVQKLAFLKADDVARRVDSAIIIGADTIVLHNESILGKPKDKHDAKRMLLMLSNSEHEIISGVCVIDVPAKKKFLRFGRTHIRMRQIMEKEVEMYIRSGEGMDKAGAYAIQGEGKKFVEKIDGSYSNAIGLPLEIVREMLNNILCESNA